LPKEKEPKSLINKNSFAKKEKARTSDKQERKGFQSFLSFFFRALFNECFFLIMDNFADARAARALHIGSLLVFLASNRNFISAFDTFQLHSKQCHMYLPTLNSKNYQN
jgi:hypothetical protein